MTSAITNGLAGGNAQSGSNANGSKGTRPGSPKNQSSKPATPGSDPADGAAATPDASSVSPTTTDTSTTPKSASSTKTSVPALIAQVPLTALDALKTEIPIIAAAIPLPGMSALPAIADAVITPLQQAVSGLASAASGLPFMQIDLSQTLTATTLPTNRFQRNAPTAGLKPKTSGPDPLTPSITPLDEPVQPAQAPAPEAPKPDQTFSASSHFNTQPDFRPGYPDYLRAAGLSEVAAVAVPGFAGIITLTCAGGLLGYRQARAGRTTAPSRVARFVS